MRKTATDLLFLTTISIKQLYISRDELLGKNYFGKLFIKYY